MQAELTNEEIVTKLLVSNEMLNGNDACYVTHPQFDLSGYMTTVSEDKIEIAVAEVPKYKFINYCKSWNF